MIVSQFLFWLRSAPAGERAEATAALARAYPLFRSVERRSRRRRRRDDHAARRSVAAGARGARGSSGGMRHGAGLRHLCTRRRSARDCSIVLERSPLLLDADLVDAVASQGPLAQCAIARRAYVPRSVAAAIAEVGEPKPVLSFWKIAAPKSRPSPSTASSSASGILRRSARSCWRGPICRSHPPGAGRKTFRDARRIRGRARLAERRSRAPRHQGSLREGDRRARGRMPRRTKCVR